MKLFKFFKNALSILIIGYAAFATSVAAVTSDPVPFRVITNNTIPFVVDGNEYRGMMLPDSSTLTVDTQAVRPMNMVKFKIDKIRYYPTVNRPLVRISTSADGVLWANRFQNYVDTGWTTVNFSANVRYIRFYLGYNKVEAITINEIQAFSNGQNVAVNKPVSYHNDPKQRINDSNNATGIFISDGAVYSNELLSMSPVGQISINASDFRNAYMGVAKFDFYCSTNGSTWTNIMTRYIQAGNTVIDVPNKPTCMFLRFSMNGGWASSIKLNEVTVYPGW